MRLNAAHCTFHDKDLEIHLQILAGLRDDILKQKLLEEGDLTLEQTLPKCEAFETAHHQLAAMGSQSNLKQESAYRIQQQQSNNKYQPGNRFSEEDRRGKPNEDERQQQQRLCSYCGGDYHRTLSDCPAKGHRCDICRKFNHFEDVCRQKQPQRDRQDPSTNGDSRRYQQDPAAKAKVNFLYGDSSEEENAFRLHSYQAINESSDTGSEEDVVEVLSPQQQQHQQRNSSSGQFQTVKGGDETYDGYGTTLSISNRPGAANHREKEEKEAVEEIEANNIHQFFESLSLSTQS